MKTTLTFAAALLCGTATIAQTTTPPAADPPAGTTATGSASSGSDSNQMPMGDGAAQTGQTGTGAPPPAGEAPTTGSAETTGQTTGATTGTATDTTTSGAAGSVTTGTTAGEAATSATATDSQTLGGMNGQASASGVATDSATGATDSAVQTADLSGSDRDNDGALNPLEFAQMWAKSAAGQSAMAAKADRERTSKKANNAAVDLLNQTATAFGKADTSRDMRVTSDELAAWQAAGSPTA